MMKTLANIKSRLKVHPALAAVSNIKFKACLEMFIS